MKLVFITQDENLYLPIFFKKVIEDLKLNTNFNIEKIFLLPSSPNSKKASLVKRGLESLFLFGINFFLFYTTLYLYRKFVGKNLKKIFLKNNIPFDIFSGSIKSKKFIDSIKIMKPDLIISASCNQIFNIELLKIPNKGCLNIHSSLLPKDRGLMPSFWSLCKNYKYSGVSTFFMNEYLDDGPILYQEKFNIEGLSLHSLLIKNKIIGAKILIKSLDMINMNKILLTKNLQKESSYNHYPKKEDVKIFRMRKKKFF